MQDEVSYIMNWIKAIQIICKLQLTGLRTSDILCCSNSLYLRNDVCRTSVYPTLVVRKVNSYAICVVDAILLTSWCSIYSKWLCSTRRPCVGDCLPSINTFCVSQNKLNTGAQYWDNCICASDAYSINFKCVFFV